MEGRGWLDEREARAWRGLQLVRAHVNAEVNRRLQRRFGLSGADYEVLVNLSESPDDRMRAFELAEAMQWEKSRLSHHLGRMEARGLIERKDCDTDRRGAYVVLTREGRAAIEEAAPQHVADVREVFVDALTPAQLESLGDAFEIVLQRLRGPERD